MIGYEELVQRMNNAYTEKTGIVPDEASDTGIRFRVLAGEVYNLLADLEWLQQSLTPQTAVGEQLDKLAQNGGLERVQAAHAAGRIKFTNNGSSMFGTVLPAGTRCTTAGTPPVLVETLEEADLPTSAGGSTEVAAQAVETGPGGNLPAGAVTALVNPNSYIQSVTNTVAFSGGRSVETDDQLRKRLLEKYKQQSNGANPAFYWQLALQQDGVASASVETAAPAKGEVTVWLAGKGAAASDSTVQNVQKVMEEKRELNVKVHVYPAKTASVSVSVAVASRDGTSPDTVKTAVQETIRNDFQSLKVGETVTETQLCAQIYGTGLINEAKLETGISFPDKSPDTLVVLNGEPEVSFL